MTPTDFQTHFQARLARTTHLMLDAIERILDALKRSLEPEGPLTPERALLWRFVNDRLALAAKCEKPACRRARRCKGEPRSCLRRHVPKLPAKSRNRAAAELRALQARCAQTLVRAPLP